MDSFGSYRAAVGAHDIEIAYFCAVWHAVYRGGPTHVPFERCCEFSGGGLHLPRDRREGLLLHFSPLRSKNGNTLIDFILSLGTAGYVGIPGTWRYATTTQMFPDPPGRIYVTDTSRSPAEGTVGYIRITPNYCIKQTTNSTQNFLALSVFFPNFRSTNVKVAIKSSRRSSLQVFGHEHVPMFLAGRHLKVVDS